MVLELRSVTQEERELLEKTARSLIKLQDDCDDRVTGMEIVLRELVRSERPSLTLARLCIRADLLRLKGTPSAYLDSFVLNLKADLRPFSRWKHEWHKKHGPGYPSGLATHNRRYQPQTSAA